MITNYFNDLRSKGIKVNPDDTIWIDTFCTYVIENNIIDENYLFKALSKTIDLLDEKNTTKDVIALLKKFDIDYEPIEKQYQISLTKWKEILK